MAFWSRKAQDPICGMDVVRKEAAGSIKYQGQTYYVCSPRCKTILAKKLKKLAKGGAVGAGAAGGSCH